MTVPSSSISRIVGAGGRKLEEILRETGVNVTVPAKNGNESADTTIQLVAMKDEHIEAVS